MITIDNRSGSKELYPLISLPRELIEFENYNLPGDVTFNGNIASGNINGNLGIEVKKLHDLVSSLDNGRLQGQGNGIDPHTRGQLLRMIDVYDVNWLVTYGTYFAENRGKANHKANLSSFLSSKPIINYLTQPLRKVLRYKTTKPIHRSIKPMNLGNRPCYWNGISSAITELQYAGFYYHHLHDLNEVASYIEVLYRWYNKPFNSHKLFKCFNETSRKRQPVSGLIPHIDDSTLVRANFLIGLDGVGFTLAIRIASKYTSIETMIAAIAANPYELIDIKGISKPLSRKIHNIIIGEKVNDGLGIDKDHKEWALREAINKLKQI